MIEKLPRDILIYAHSVLTVIETVLQSNEISMVEDSIATFETFCRHQDMTALAAEHDIADQYRGVVRTYASFAEANPSAFSKIPRSPPVTFRWRNAGLRAIKAVVGSEGLAADGGESLKIVLPVVLENLYTGRDDVLGHLQERLQEPETNETDVARRRRVSVATVDTPNGDVALASQTATDVDMKAEMDVRLLALRCLERVVVSGSNRGQIRIATGVVLRFILGKGPIRAKDNEKCEEATGENWATTLIELIAKWCPVQVRFVILVSAMELLSEIRPTEKELEKPFTIIYLVDWLLKSQVNMIGLSVMDVLLGLMHYISLLTLPENKGTPGNGTTEKQDAHHEPELSNQRRALLSLLEKCIGSLATHVYYVNQVADSVKAVLSRLKPNHDTLPTHQLGGQPDSPASAANPEMNNNGFSYATAKVAALNAVKNILIVDNLKRPTTTVGVESRGRIGIDVWEGTQWLLRSSEREVRYAYADAFLTWMKFETDKSDLRLKDENGKRSTGLAKRELQESGDHSVKRTASSTLGQREQAALVTQSNFLRLFHLTVYDVALEYAAEESEILLLHLLLTTLIERLGVNAIRFGLPMTLKLQDDVATADSQCPLAAKVNIGSLGYGYLWVLSEKINLEAFKVGSQIGQEIERRNNLGLWLQRISSPPVPLENIVSGGEAPMSEKIMGSPSQLTPFRSSIQELVDRIEDAYNSSAMSPAQSPPSSPNRSHGVPVFGHAMSSASSQKPLPHAVKEQMLSPWSREACLAAVEQESAKAMSLNGSRVGTAVLRNHIQVNGDSSRSASNSPIYAHQGDAAAMGASAAAPHIRRDSAPESLSNPAGSSSRGSPVRVNELRRVLSVNDEGQRRRLSPLRGRLDASCGSIVSSSSDSVVSGNFSVSDMGEDGTSLRRQSTRGGQSVINDDGMDTPRASTAVLPGSSTHPEQSKTARNMDPNGIPPVPPLPANLSIPGTFPNDSQRSFSSGDRPTSAPGGGKKPYVNGMASSHDQNGLDKRKSRSITGLAAEAGIEDPAMLRYLGIYGNGDTIIEEGEDSDRRDIENLLNRSLSPDGGGPSNGDSLSAIRREQKSYLSRKGTTRGIGRPPY